MTYIYVIASDTGPIKVGISNNPERRLLALRNNIPRALRLAYSEELLDIKARIVETETHAFLASKRAHGEWFNVTVDEAVFAISTVARKVRNAPSRSVRNQATAQMRAARALVNLSLEHVASAAGVHRNTISNFETGRYAVDPDKLAAVRAALEVAGVQFVAEDDDGGLGVRLAKPSSESGA